jgi:phosphoglycerate dehydrogenase-like enzyme
MTKPTILLWLDEAETYRRAVAAAGLEERCTLVAVPRAATPDAALLASADAVLAWGAAPGLLDRMPRLRWVQALTAGVEMWLGRPDVTDRFALCCARGTHRVAMPENILGALFHITKPYTQAVLAQREHKWARKVGQPLAGRTLGILGLGAIGAELAKKAAALELRVIGTKRVVEDVPHVEKVLPPDRTAEVLAESDFLVVLLPLTPDTENSIDAGFLAQMKPTAWLLNFGRGALVVDADLIAAVQQQRIAGAVLDVFRQEPLPPEHPFWATEGVLVLPHIGGGHPTRDAIVAELFVENLGRFLDGRPLAARVDLAVGY